MHYNNPYYIVLANIIFFILPWSSPNKMCHGQCFHGNHKSFCNHHSCNSICLHAYCEFLLFFNVFFIIIPSVSNPAVSQLR